MSCCPEKEWKSTFPLVIFQISGLIFYQPFCFLPENGFVMINVLLSLYPSLRSHTVYSCNNKFKSVILSAVSAFKRKREKKKTFLRSACCVNSIVHLHTLVCCCDLWHSFSICTVQLYNRKKEKIKSTASNMTLFLECDPPSSHIVCYLLLLKRKIGLA